MFRLLMIFSALITHSLVIAQKKRSSFILTVNSQKIPQIKKLYLYYRLNDGNYKLDSAHSFSGKFIFKGSITNPLLAELHKKNPKEYYDSTFSFFIDFGKTSISLSNDFSVNPVFSGSHNSKVWSEYFSADLSQTIKLAKELNFTSDQLNDSDTLHYLRLRLQKDFFKKYPTSFASLEIFRFHIGLRGKTMKYFPLLQENSQSLDPILFKSEPGKNVTKILNQIQNIRDSVIFPDFILKLSDSNIFKASRFKGMILIDFWASWCEPCIEDFPFLKKLAQVTSKDSLTILSISIDESSTSWRKAIDKYKIQDWKHALAIHPFNKKAVSTLFYQPVIPIKMLLDRNRKIIGWWRGRDTIHETEILKLIETKILN